MFLTERRLRMPIAMGIAILGVACGQDSRAAPPPESGGPAASPRPVPTTEVQPTPTPLIEVTPRVEIAPTTPPTELKRERTFTGTYIGTTSEGRDVGFVVESGNIIHLFSIKYNIPGCPTDNMLAVAKDPPIKQNSFSFTEFDALQGTRVTIQGTFGPDSNVWKGNADIDCKGSKLQVGWSASFVELNPQTQIPPEVLVTRIPNLKIPQGLFLPGENLQNPYGFSVTTEKGDWFLVAAFDSLYPVPKGWLISTIVGEDNGLLLYAKGGVELEGRRPNKKPEIAIQIGGSEGGVDTADTIEQAFTKIEKVRTSAPQTSIVRKSIIDAKRGYIFTERTLDSGVKSYRLIVASKLYSKGMGRETFRTLTADAEGQAWFDYYPVTRAIVANWASTIDNSTVGVALPERLP
ncbi:hypothetical protein HYV21_00245 [Candidatus Microgenomates bacterium]|nr:hypothetical protein [Candidatus Microgenomates bacterium]